MLFGMWGGGSEWIIPTFLTQPILGRDVLVSHLMFVSPGRTGMEWDEGVGQLTTTQGRKMAAFAYWPGTIHHDEDEEERHGLFDSVQFDSIGSHLRAV